MVTVSNTLTEHGLIGVYFAPLAASGGLGLLDDAAVLTPSPGYDLVLTVDAVVAGVHYLPDDDPRHIARKALGVNISDIAAKGAEPKGFLLTLGLADDWQEPWISAFAEELGNAARDWRCPLYGGDTVRANGAPFISITVFGEVPKDRMVQRGGARPGDILCVSGTIGDAALGLALALGQEELWMAALDETGRAYLKQRYRLPQPRLALAPVIQRYAHAAMDVSDGLIGDVGKILKASHVSVEIDLTAVPLSVAAQAALMAEEGCLDTIVTGGDDYEILCAVPPEHLQIFLSEAQSTGILMTAIGLVTVEVSPFKYLWQGKPRQFAQGAFSHF